MTSALPQRGKWVLSVCAHSFFHVFFLCLKSIQGHRLLNLGWLLEMVVDECNRIRLKVRMIKNGINAWIPGGIYFSWWRAALVWLMYLSSSIWSISGADALHTVLDSFLFLFLFFFAPTSSLLRWYWLENSFLKFQSFPARIAFRDISFIKVRGCLFSNQKSNFSPLLSFFK